MSLNDINNDLFLKYKLQEKQIDIVNDLITKITLKANLQEKIIIDLKKKLENTNNTINKYILFISINNFIYIIWCMFN